MSRGARVPKVAAAYFDRHPILRAQIPPDNYDRVSADELLRPEARLVPAYAHPVIARAYRPGKGWKLYEIKKRVSGSWARKMQRAGYTHVELGTGGVAADFSLRELCRR